MWNVFFFASSCDNAILNTVYYMKEFLYSVQYILFSQQMIFFIAGIFVSSCVYGLTITQNPKLLMQLYLKNPQESFLSLTERSKGTFTTSYSTHKRRVRIFRIVTITSLVLLCLGILALR